MKQGYDKTELAFKLAATFLATTVFMALGVGALGLTPVARHGGARSRADTAARDARNGREAPLPVPPQSTEVKVERMEAADLYLYETRLGAAAVRRFYAVELPPRGWQSVELPAAGTPEERELLLNTMYFTDGTVSCIITLEEKDFYLTHIAVVLTSKIGN